MRLLPATIAAIVIVTSIFVANSKSLAQSEPAARVWKDKSGKYRVEATLERATIEKVTLKRIDDGRLIDVPVNSLCDEDLAHVRNGFPELFKTVAERFTSATALEAAAQRRRFAIDALAMYDRFMADEKVPLAERQSAKKARENWMALAQAKKIHVGRSWYTPAEYADLLKDEQKILDSADELLRTGSLATVTKKLKEASSLIPTSVRAEFRLGVLEALHPEGHSAEKAGDFFNTCIKRLNVYEQDLSDVERANLAACYNNLALTSVRQKQIGEAIRAWERCIRTSKPPDPVLHNLAHLLALASESGPRGTSLDAVRVTDTEKERLGRLCTSLPNLDNAHDPKRGWRYMRLAEDISGPNANDAAATSSSPSAGAPAENLILLGTGTGFLVGKNLVATNRHVTEVGTAYAVRRDGESRSAALPAKLVAASSEKKVDLALLRCERDLVAAPLSFNASDLRLSTEIRTLGFPHSELLGSNIKVTSGIVTSLPPLEGIRESELRDYVMHDAVINGGCSGGPLCDRNGMIVGVNTAHFPNLNYSLAVSMKQVTQFLKPLVTDLQVQPPSENGAKTWEDAVEAVRRSTVQVLVFARADRFSPIVKASDQKKWDTYDDPWCMACYGRAHIECPIRGCANGGVITYKDTAVRFADGTVHTRRTPVRIDCSKCRGTGRVDCPCCQGGIDPQISTKN